jgi:hypothetical protein
MCLLYLLLHLLCACEHTKIYADPPVEEEEAIEASVSLGFCQDDSDCQQWSCIQSKCEDGLCQALRADAILSTATLWEEDPLAQQFVIDTHLDGQDLYVLSGRKSIADAQLNHWRWEEDRWVMQDMEKLLPYMKKIYVQGEIYFGIEGEDQRSVRIFTDELVGGKRIDLSDRAQAVVLEEGNLWVSTFQKGVTLLDANLIEDGVSLPRFNTAGRALDLAVGRSYVVVADGYAGLSVFLRRPFTNKAEASRALQTPAQELSTQGQVISVDLKEGYILTAEWGAGVGLYQIDPITGLRKIWVHGLEETVLATRFIDPYTALVWIQGKRVLMLDLLGTKPKVLAELKIDDLENESRLEKYDFNEIMHQDHQLSYTWQSKNGHIIGSNNQGQIWSARYQCSFTKN